MKKLGRKWKFGLLSLLTLVMVLCCLSLAAAKDKPVKDKADTGETETAGNNLSFPVIWAEGVEKPPPGTAGIVSVLGGEWWYWWGTEGTDPNVVPLACPPDPDDLLFCDNGVAGTIGEEGIPDELWLPGDGWVRAYLQKDSLNIWQAESLSMKNDDGTYIAPINVHWIDWGDNLESVDWYTRSQVRTEVVLYQDLDIPMLEYDMRHVSGWGIDEVHGLAVAQDGTVLDSTVDDSLGTQATVYSHCARLTIQKLLVKRDDPALADLVWVPKEGWEEPEGYDGDLINPEIFNGAVHEGGDGPGYYSAEINVKGKVIYGYTWNVRKLNDITNETPAGDYRITFSFDSECSGVALNTFFDEETEIMVPLEEDVAVVESDDGSTTTGGATAVLDIEHNLTYIDVRILARSSGGGNGGGNQNGNGE